MQVLEWWYTSAEEKLTPNVTLPIPPAPPVVPPHPKGVRLPPDVHLCPLCVDVRNNAAICSTSGYMFCYPCIYRHVQAHESCPVTLEQTAVEDVWKIYQDRA